MNKNTDQIHFSELPPPPFPQGELAFVEELKTYAHRKVHWNSNAPTPVNCLYLMGKWQIKKNFPDPENLLGTAYSALERFAENSINQDVYLEPVCCSMSSSNCCFLTCILRQY